MKNALETPIDRHTKSLLALTSSLIIRYIKRLSFDNSDAAQMSRFFFALRYGK